MKRIDGRLSESDGLRVGGLGIRRLDELVEQIAHPIAVVAVLRERPADDHRHVPAHACASGGASAIFTGEAGSRSSTGSPFPP